MRKYDTHRCEGSLRSHCSVRLYHASAHRFAGEWHLWTREYDSEWDCTYMSHVARIRFCPWCGKELK